MLCVRGTIIIAGKKLGDILMDISHYMDDLINLNGTVRQ